MSRTNSFTGISRRPASASRRLASLRAAATSRTRPHSEHWRSHSKPANAQQLRLDAFFAISPDCLGADLTLRHGRGISRVAAAAGSRDPAHLEPAGDTAIRLCNASAPEPVLGEL